jgi:hypothetical protein
MDNIKWKVMVFVALTVAIIVGGMAFFNKNKTVMSCR